MPDIIDATLNNGLRLITIKKDSRIMAVNLGFRVGAMMDPAGKKGLAHFLEHMLFTGTKKRSHDAVNEELEFLGGDVNAFTDLTQLTLAVSALTGETEPALEILSDLVQNAVFTPEETERERQVILSEYKEGLEDLENVSYDLLYEKSWPEDPLILNVIGSADTIASLTREDLVRHKDRFLTPGNAVLSIASELSHEQMRSLAERYFARWEKKPAPPRAIAGPRNGPGRFETENDSSDMATVTLLYHFPDLPKEEETALKVLNRRLGDSDNSMLFKEIRLKRGLSYDIYSSLDLTPQVRTLEIYCATEPEHAREVLLVIEQIIEGIKSGQITFMARDLDLASKKQNTSSAGLLDDTPALCGYITANALDELPLLHFEKELHEMSKLNIQDLHRAADLVFHGPTISLMLPRDDADEMEQ